MIPLRVFGILTNIVLIASAIPTHNYPTLVLHSVLLLLNSYRLHQMLQLVRDVKKSVNSDLSMEWLKPFMTERKCAAGEVLFYKDEKAEDMLYIVSGRFRLVESGIELPVGAIVGELGMLSPSNMRTQTLECIEAGLILSVSYKQGRGALRAESGLRLLLPAPRQRPAVSEHRNAGAAAGAAWTASGRPRRSPPEGPGQPRWQVFFPRSVICSPISSARTMTRRHSCLTDCPTASVPVVSEGIHLLIDYQGAELRAALCRSGAALRRQERCRSRRCSAKSPG